MLMDVPNFLILGLHESFGDAAVCIEAPKTILIIGIVPSVNAF
jgi:hypothetical protein